MRTFVLGDLHGAYRALRQCFEKADFDNQADELIFLGDVSDGWSQVPECVEELRNVKNLHYIKGNHDIWFMEWLDKGYRPEIWMIQGGLITVQAYRDRGDLAAEHLAFLKMGKPFYIDSCKRLFVHAGFTYDKPIEFTDDPALDYYWDRDLYKRSFQQEILPERYKEIYIGHTPSHGICQYPIKNHNVWLMDQGAGWNGYLSMMDINTKEVFQSENVIILYPDEPGRSG
ncbi:MAG: metallophosphoesterase [Cyclobacteriaceae bacterium]|nr:metallophosphoesterase [Cyclobacteriaceae bacterium]